MKTAFEEHHIATNATCVSFALSFVYKRCLAEEKKTKLSLSYRIENDICQHPDSICGNQRQMLLTKPNQDNTRGGRTEPVGFYVARFAPLLVRKIHIVLTLHLQLVNKHRCLRSSKIVTSCSRFR